MKFLKSFIFSVIGSAVVFYSVVVVLIDTPVPAEYWVAEMIIVKKQLAKEQSGRKKMVIAGGSSTLFGIDAEYASRQLDMPVINFGLHAGLKLEKILYEVSEVVEGGDILILALEPQYFECHPGWSLWQMNNVVGWDHDAWNSMSYFGKIEFVAAVSPSLFRQMVTAKIQKYNHSPVILKREEAKDSAKALSRYRSTRKPRAFEYSVNNLNSHGDILLNEGAVFKGAGDDIGKPNHVCHETAEYLRRFANNMKTRGVRVYFANTPYLAPGADISALRRSESNFLGELGDIGCMIDMRKNMIFERKYFYNSNLHLNAEGRSLRTAQFIQAIRKNVFSGSCTH